MLELQGITKSFGAVRALRGVDLTFRPGEVHGLLGENGAGKSTLLKIITGVHRPDAGTVRLAGTSVTFRSVRESQAAGIRLVHQELCVIPDASLAENLFLPDLRRSALGLVRWDDLLAEAEPHLQRVGLDLPPDTLARGLSAAQKQLLQIAQALSTQARYLFLDEPTSCLTEHEAARLFTLVRRLREEGVGIVFVSHKLEEVFALCDRVSVLRDGTFIGSSPLAALTPPDVIRWMIGRDCQVDHLGPLAPHWDKPVLTVRELVREGPPNRASFTLHRGEILGFYGLIGAGRTEVARALIGADPRRAGSAQLQGQDFSPRSVGECLKKFRVGYVSENRKESGVFLFDGVERNLSLPALTRLPAALARLVSGARERKLAAHWAEALAVKTDRLETPVGHLSGGNQQKVSIGKWLAADCDVLIIDEPTIGVDVGAKRQIHQLLWNLAAREGKSLIVISSDLAELVALVNRLLVFRSGHIVGEVRDIDRGPKSYAQVTQELAPFFA